MTAKNQMRAFLVGGLLPVILFTLIEEYYGTLYGLIAGMVFGGGEILFEWVRFKKVEKITLFGNGLLLVLGGISLFTSEGIWFKLQPAVIELVMGILLIGSVVVKKPLLLILSEKQGSLINLPEITREFFKKYFSGLTFRIGVFFLLHAAIATWAALYWSTKAWALLKGLGFTGSLIAYMVLEAVVMRRLLRYRASK